MPVYELYNITTQTVKESGKVFTLQEVAEVNDLLRQARSPMRYIRQHEPPPAGCTCGAEYQFECICEQLPDDAPNPHENQNQ